MRRFRFSKLYNYLFLVLILMISFTMVGLSSWNVFDAFNLDFVKLEPVCYISNSKGKTDYYSVEAALEKAKSGDFVYTYIGKNPTIRKSVEIKSGVTLCLPFEQDATNNINKYNGRQTGDNSSKWFDDCGGDFSDSNPNNVAKYRKNSLKLAKNVELTNNGNLYIGGVLGWEGQNLSGATSGNYCEIVMDSNSKIVNIGTIECYGYIKEAETNNNSQLIAESGIVCSPFVVHDYGGGNNTVGCYSKGKISPFSIFSMPNIQVYSRYNYNSVLKGMADLYTDKFTILSARHNTTDIDIISNKSSIIILTNQESYVETKYDSPSPLYTTNDEYATKDDEVSKTIIKLHNGASNGPMSMKVSVGGVFNEDVNTQNVLFPISYKYDISLYDGSYTFTTPIKVMNGARLLVDETASLNVNSDFIVYSKEFNDGKGAFKYPIKPNAELIVNGSITYNKSNGGLTQTLSTKSDYSYIYENSSNLSVTSKEGTGSVTSFTTSCEMKETAQAKLETASGISVSNIETSVYISEKNTDYFAKASNLGKYTINYHLNGGTVDGETVTDDVITKEYPILKDKPKTLIDYALSSPKKKFYSFSGWRLVSSTGESASGQVVRDGYMLDVYASYELKTYSITYNVLYAEGLEMSDKYQNLNPTSFTMEDLKPLTISKPTDGDLNFYGWYFNNDTSKEILQITKDMEGIGYDDITLSGYFSDKTMCAVTFDANGHNDYFKNLSSFNMVTDDPTKVTLPESLYDYVPTKEYYLIGWEDSNGNIFNGNTLPDTYGEFGSETLTLKAKRGNKFKVLYNVCKTIINNNKYGEIKGQVIDYIKPGNLLLRNESSFENDFGTSNVDEEDFKTEYVLQSWECEGKSYGLNETYQNVQSDLTFNGVYRKSIKYKLTIIIEGSSNKTRRGQKIFISSSSLGELEYEIPAKRHDITEIFYVEVGDKINFRMNKLGLYSIKWKIYGGINKSGNTDNAVNETWTMVDAISTIDVNY